MNLRRFFETAIENTQFEALPIAEGELDYCNKSLIISSLLLQRLAQEAFFRTSHFFTKSHISQLIALRDASHNSYDTFVLESFIKNARIASKGVLPLCQDTGTAQIIACKDEGVLTRADDYLALSAGIERAWSEGYLRSSQNIPLNMYDEIDSGNNLPASIHIQASSPTDRQNPEYHFLFVAKGGGSANRTSFFTMTKALLNEESLKAFLLEKMRALGSSACPPYHLCFVVGGSSPEENLSILKLGTAGLFDAWPGKELPLRDRGLEAWLLDKSRTHEEQRLLDNTAFLASCTILRLSRHAASLFVSVGVSCVAHRNVLAKISKQGVLVEKLEQDLAGYERPEIYLNLSAPSIQLSEGMHSLLEELAKHKAGSLLRLSGPLLLARDAAHARWLELLKSGLPLPDYVFEHPIYYAGPARKPPGYASGSLGPTTSSRMDEYAAPLMAQGASLVSIGKGGRTAVFIENCKKYGGYYLGAIGGVAALPAQENIISSRIIDYEDLGMEAVRLVEVKDLPVRILIDRQGNGP